MSANTGEHTSTSPGNRQERGHEHGEAAVGRVHGTHSECQEIGGKKMAFPKSLFQMSLNPMSLQS